MNDEKQVSFRNKIFNFNRPRFIFFGVPFYLELLVFPIGIWKKGRAQGLEYSGLAYSHNSIDTVLYKAPCKRTQHCWMLHVTVCTPCCMYAVACCWELLHPFAHGRNNSQHCWELFRPFARSLKTKLKSNQNTLLGKHRQNILQDIIVKLRAIGGNIVAQQLLTLFDVTCCVHLHTLLHVVGSCCPKF